MIVKAETGADELVRAIEELGGTVTWSATGKPRCPVAKLEVEVDDDEAFERLPSRYLERALFDTDCAQDLADERDVADFVRACGTRDVIVATALVPRLFNDPRNQAACDLTLSRLA